MNGVSFEKLAAGWQRVVALVFAIAVVAAPVIAFAQGGGGGGGYGRRRHGRRDGERQPGRRSAGGDRRRGRPRPRVGGGAPRDRSRDLALHAPAHRSGAPLKPSPVALIALQQRTQRAGGVLREQVDRREYGLGWCAALETGGVLVGEKLAIELEALKKVAAQPMAA